MIVKDVVTLLEEISPLAYSEGFDNTGLLVGDEKMKVTGILVTLDTLEAVVDEAIEKGYNLIVSFHPIVFSGLKKLTGKTYVERVVQKAIKHDIAIFSNHTALDNAWNGVNAMICEKLGLQNRKVLIPKDSTIKKLVTFVPVNDVEKVRNAIFEAGGGSIGNYDKCSFNTEGIGTFNGNDSSNPVVGKKGVTQFEKEVKLEITFGKHLQSNVLKSLFNSHPYEEVAYEITTLENFNQHIGMGMIGELKAPMTEIEFLKFLKETMRTNCVRHSALLNKSVKKIAVLGGSGSFAINAAKSAGADVFISADFKYHDFFQAENKIILADIGHYESEQFTKELLYSFLTKKITNFAPALQKGIAISDIITNPISYL
ncbi:Nif3-like dinuclear metal center hexameric protein [Aequorivita viscosa]|uniref:GTP cyclohydrolase 1 type 2 homolog n=1 Tax=Aequorivita viscosa TaxID=797419 RepID=A0A1M6HVF7_9FLAO|nr:Nif3-like dinuclear metal center hexameric protein [Aequorivita viscosa]SDW94540.1 dinuclear metal center protein, YbgI/SA1388 family [Aequorivita viscosa]SHJ26210.1 dinuclear metal center protein, YbgI/SA1388 family [Aequorivita viscosa]